MANINIKIDTGKDLTTFTVEGVLTAAEILQYSSEYYEKSPTKYVLWDATAGSVSKITNEEFSKIAKYMKKYTKKRAGGKTALVGRFDIDFGLARQYGAYAEIEQLPVEYQIFRSVEEAMKWLQF